LGLHDARLIAPATHDTGSAVAGAPLSEDQAYISSGTWSLIGVERDAALINDDVERYNFTNEGGAFGTFRFLKNVMGLWIFESCRKEWKANGIDIEYDAILRAIVGIADYRARSEEHTSELQSPYDLVCRLLLEKKKHDETH